MKQKTNMKAFVGILLIASLMVPMIGCNASKTAASASSISSEIISSSEPTVESVSDVSSSTSIVSSTVSSAVSKTSSAKTVSKASSTARTTKKTVVPKVSKQITVPKKKVEINGAKSSDTKAETAYIQKIVEIENSIAESVNNLKSNSDSANTKTAYINFLSSFEQSFKALGNLNAPAKYAEAQACYKKASAEGVAGLEILKNCVNSATESSDRSALTAKLQEGQEDLYKAIADATSGDQKLNAIG